MNGYNLGPVPVGHTAPSDLVREALPSEVAGDSGPALDALAAAISSRMTHPESHDKYQVFEVTPGSAVAAGTVLLWSVPLGFLAKTLVVDNPTSYWIEIPELRRKIGPGTNICVPCFPTTRQLSAVIYAGSDTTGLAITIIPTERVISTSAGGGTTDSSAFTPIGAAHHVASTITLDGGGLGNLAARANRTGMTLSAPLSNAADVVIGASGFHLEAGASLQLSAIDAFAFSGAAGDLIYVLEEYQGIVSGATHHTAQVLTIAGGTATLASRATRTALILHARSSNLSPIVVGASGFPIEPGGTLNASALDAWAVTGTNGELLDVLEEYN
jgi:hypothetical protein